MQFEQGAPSKSRMTLTPIIDVVFLLLLFFMLASTFTRYAHVDVTVSGKTVSPVQDQKSPILILSVKPSGNYSINGQSVSMAEITSTLAAGAPDGKARIIVRPSADALAEDIIRAIEHSEAAKLGPVVMVR